MIVALGLGIVLWYGGQLVVSLWTYFFGESEEDIKAYNEKYNKNYNGNYYQYDD